MVTQAKTRKHLLDAIADGDLALHELLSAKALLLLARVAEAAPEPLDPDAHVHELGGFVGAREATEELRVRTFVRFVTKDSWRVVLDNDPMIRVALARRQSAEAAS